MATRRRTRGRRASPRARRAQEVRAGRRRRRRRRKRRRKRRRRVASRRDVARARGRATRRRSTRPPPLSTSTEARPAPARTVAPHGIYEYMAAVLTYSYFMSFRLNVISLLISK